MSDMNIAEAIEYAGWLRQLLRDHYGDTGTVGDADEDLDKFIDYCYAVALRDAEFDHNKTQED
jgi:hypothetical protein